MREADFEVLLRLVERLGGEQRAALGRALASAPGEPEAARLLEDVPVHGHETPICA
jgi:phage protein D